VPYESSASVIYTSEMYSQNTNFHILRIFLRVFARFRTPGHFSNLTAEPTSSFQVSQIFFFPDFCVTCLCYTGRQLSEFPYRPSLCTILYRRLSLICTTHQHISLQYQTPRLPLTNISFSDFMAFELCDLINYLKYLQTPIKTF